MTFKYNIKCFRWENTIKALGDRDNGLGGRMGGGLNIIMHFS